MAEKKNDVLENETETAINANKRTDLYQVDPRNIAPNPNNHRHIDIEDDDMKELIASIRANGIITPMMLKPNPTFGVDGETREYVSYAGNRRLTATMAIINHPTNPMDIKRVPAQIKKNVKLEDEYLTQIIENSGKPFTLFEKAEVIKELNEICGWTPSEIEEKTGESQAMISNMLKIAGMSKKHKKMISDNTLAPTMALQIVRESDTPEEFDAKMEELFTLGEELKASGKKSNGKRALITGKNAEKVLVKKTPIQILESVSLKLIKNEAKGKAVDIFIEATKLLRKRDKTTEKKILDLFE